MMGVEVLVVVEVQRLQEDRRLGEGEVVVGEKKTS